MNKFFVSVWPTKIPSVPPPPTPSDSNNFFEPPPSEFNICGFFVRFFHLLVSREFSKKFGVDIDLPSGRYFWKIRHAFPEQLDFCYQKQLNFPALRPGIFFNFTS